MEIEGKKEGAWSGKCHFWKGRGMWFFGPICRPCFIATVLNLSLTAKVIHDPFLEGILLKQFLGK